jgi:hypothetical protein
MFCKDVAGLPLAKCLRKMKEGDTSNTNKHLKDVHKATLAQIDAEEKARIKVKKGGKVSPHIISES